MNFCTPTAATSRRIGWPFGGEGPARHCGLPVIMSVRPSPTQPPPPRLKPLHPRRPQNRNTADADHLQLRRSPFGTHYRAPTTIQGSTSTQSPSLGTATGMVEDVEAGSSGVREADSQKKPLPPLMGFTTDR